MEINSDSQYFPSLEAVSTSTSFSSSARSISSSSLERSSTVAVIGCGPGGMSFLHAVATRRKRLEDKGDLEALMRLPVVTCFERDSSPGGVWRSNDVNEEESMSNGVFETTSKPSTSMYEGLWINCHKDAMEFEDYTFEDHFGGPLPVYLPRKQILEYLLARATSQGDIFQSVNFNTTVQSVIYDETMDEFVIMTIDNLTEESTTRRFDKCIWAGGLNGRPKFAPDIVDMLKKQKFKGQVVHSTDMGSLSSSVKGKRIMMVGDSYSAEDLSLQCLKLGAEKIFITSRKACGSASYMGAWPGDRVKMLWYKLPYGVTKDGHGIVCKDSRRSQEQSQIDAESTEIENISIVIFCTGYEPNLHFLEPKLSSWYRKCKNPTWSVPKDWKMKENTLSSAIGDVKPATQLDGNAGYVQAGLYRNLLISNPNMMFLFEMTSHPIMQIDVSACLCLGYICGDINIPTVEVMEKHNWLQLLQEMQWPWIRYYIDKSYSESNERIPWEHWYYDYRSEGYLQYCIEGCSYEVKLMARDMVTCGYPLKLGNYEKLNSAGEKLAHMTAMGCVARYRLRNNSEDKSWRTFRDCNHASFSSLITETKATRLQGRWMDINDEGQNY